MKLKVCGLTAIDQFNELVNVKVDFAGFIFYKESKRYVVGKIDPDLVRNERSIVKTGVFVDEYADELLRFVEEFGLDAVQLHGNENENYISLLSPDLIKIKAIRIGEQSVEEIESELFRFENSVNYFLLDTQSEKYGGSGKKFDWQVLTKLIFPKPFFLSGGIAPEDAAEIKKLKVKIPQLYGVDINSRFETSAGIKNLELIKQFKNEIA